MKKLQEIISAFGITPETITKESGAELNDVYIVNGKYILRARDPTAYRAVDEQVAFLEKVKDCIPCKMPELLKTKNGRFEIIKNGTHWTVYPLIQGKPFGVWTGDNKHDPALLKKAGNMLKNIHKRTKDVFSKSHSQKFLKEIEVKYSKVEELLTEETKCRLQKAFKKLTSVVNKQEVCFLHGDFHAGNIIVNNDEIVGIIDLDWCRAGYYLEDVAYFVTILLKDFTKKAYTFDEERYNFVRSLYPLPEADEEPFIEYLILLALFDVYVFKFMDIKKSEVYLKYEISLLEELCRRF